MYLRASAHALAGEPQSALRILADLEAVDPGFEAAVDPHFAALRPPPRRTPPVGQFKVINRLPIRDLFPEGIAVDAVSGRTFISSLLHGGVLLVEPGRQPRWFLSPTSSGPWATLGLKIDQGRKLLWVASKGWPGRSSLQAGAPERSALFAVDLDSGRMCRRVEWRGDGKHLFNDMALASDGSVYVTDSDAGAVYRVPSGEDRFETVLPPGTLDQPNGIVLSRDGRGLLVAAEGPGLYHVSLADGACREIRLPPLVHLQGIDGLTRVGSRLIAIQNGLPPGRIVLLELDEEELML